MADPKLVPESIMDAVTGAIMGAIMTFLGMMGLLNRRFDKAHERIDSIEKSGARHSIEIATLTAHHQANTQFQDRVDRSLRNLEEQNTEQLKQNSEMLSLLGELKGTIQNHRTAG